MKKILMLLVCAFAFGVTMHAYEPIVKEGRQWVYYKLVEINENDRWVKYALPQTLYFEGDTIIRNTNYKKLHAEQWDKNYNTSQNPNPLYNYHAILCFANEYENGQVNVYYKNNYIYPFIGRCRGYDVIVYPRLDQSIENIQKHFDSVGLTVKQRNRYGTFTGTDVININGTERHVYNTSVNYIKLIEGIGMVQTNFDDFPPIANFLYLRDDAEYQWILSHVIEDGEIVFKGELYDYFAELDYFKNHENGGTAIDDIEAVQPSGGQGTDAYYDLQGRRIAEPAQPGIYIHGGKKVVVK